MKKKGLNLKQKRFIAEYLKDQNATQAAIRAGYSKRSAQQQSSDLMLKPFILNAIKEALDRIQKKSELSVEYVLDALMDVQTRCRQKVPVMEFDYAEKSLEQKKVKDPETGEMVGVWEFDSQGANKSLELLGKYLRMFVEKGSLDINHKGRIENGRTSEAVRAVVEALPIDMVKKMVEKL